jgi:hypothetical protein
MTSGPDGKGGGAAATAKGILILLLLIIGAGAGGYFFGTFQKFAPIQNVPPGTAGAVDQSTVAAQTAAQAPAVPGLGSNLKKRYWLQSSGYDKIGYAITVVVNGQSVAQINTPDRQIDITRFVKVGDNQVTFQSKLLPEGMREHKGNGSYTMSVKICSGMTLGQSGADELLTYTRNAAEFEDHNDAMNFLIVE